MSRRRRRQTQGYTPPSRVPFPAPLRPRTPFSFTGPLPPYRGESSNRLARVPALDHPARPRSVRSLMRTVLTDTRPRSATRAGLDVSRRAVTRSRSLPSLWSPGSFFQVRVPLPRAFTCAKRAIRREVLFAINGTGKGSRSSRLHTADSQVRC